MLEKIRSMFRKREYMEWKEYDNKMRVKEDVLWRNEVNKESLKNSKDIGVLE